MNRRPDRRQVSHLHQATTNRDPTGVFDLYGTARAGFDREVFNPDGIRVGDHERRLRSFIIRYGTNTCVRATTMDTNSDPSIDENTFVIDTVQHADRTAFRRERVDCRLDFDEIAM